MKREAIALLISLALFGCQSEVDRQPAAEVSEPGSTATTAAQADVTAPVIKEKSSIGFVGAKVTRDHDGGFRNFDGRIEYASGQPSRIAFEIDLNSIYTDEEKLTAHLKTPDFFDVARYPKATFVSTAIEPPAAGAPAGTTHSVRGVLDLHGVKKEVTIPVKAEQSPQGVRASSNFTINRHDWGISYRGMADDLIKDNVLIKLDLFFPPPPTAA